MRTRSFLFRAAAALCALAMVATTPTVAAADAPLGGAADSTLGSQPLLTPAQLGNGNTDGLQFGDPTDHLALVDPPGVSNDGGAHLSYPLVIPPGRGITPQLSVDYDSGGSDGWVGQGWDLSVGDISVDTRWGAPRFDPNYESETYDIDGQMLVPNALGSSWQKRVSGDRQDYTRQVETQYDQIIRHEVAPGGPKNYYWEVHDKGGNVYWYGGTPDDGGPIGTAGVSHIDRSAIVTDRNGNGVHWLLSAQRDVGVNLVKYHYQTLHYTYGSNGWVTTDSCTPSADTLCAQHTYLRDIYYTGAATKSGQPFDPPYDIHFVRESELHPDATARHDPVVSAMGGYVDLTADRLARIEVRHGTTAATGDDVRSYDQLAVRYDLDYVDGAFGKSLLHSITQVGSDGTTSATHSFDYVDRVQNNNGGYDGFGSPQDLNTGDDLPDKLLLDSHASISALGGSESNSAEGHAYIGFNPLAPEKVGSFGGSLQVGGGATDAISEWLDINGDGLPDKVFRKDGTIQYRLNRSGPGGSATFADPQTALGITKLSHDNNIGLEAAFEAYPGVTVAFGLGSEVSWGDAYFTDVNADGLPDYVSGGDVYFNHLDHGVPHFVAGDSADTAVPIDPGTADVQLPDSVKKVEQDLAAQNPLIDTVRRWTAPFGGTVRINAPVTFSPPSGFVSKDGVRVAIQHNGDELAAADLINAGSQAFTAPVSVDVKPGDRLYFRVGSVSDGAGDRVDWSPTVNYTAIDGVNDLTKLPTDVNGLSQTSYGEGADFTLSGRPDTNVLMPYAGTVRFTATVDKSFKTTDGLHVVLLHNGNPVAVTDATFASDFKGNRDVSAEFPVAAPVVPTDKNGKGSQDSVTAKLVSDTPIDLHAVSWNPTISYTSAVDRSGATIDLTKRPLTFAMTPEVSNYPQLSTHPSLPYSTSGTVGTAALSLTVGKNNVGGPAIVTIKNRDGVLARATVTLPDIAGTVSVNAKLNTDLPQGAYWFDVTIPDPRLAAATTLHKFTLKATSSGGSDVDVPATLYGAGLQGIFPVPYRGWAAAGYNGDGARATAPIDESAFVLDPDKLKDKYSQPTGFDQVRDNPPQPDKSYAYLPEVNAPTTPDQPDLPAAAWVGTRAELAATGDHMSSSRLSADAPAPGAIPNGSGRAVTRVAITGPEAKLAFGIGPLAASFGVGPSLGLVDYQDMNGDGFPDVITPNHITYTRPRGGYDASSSGAGDLPVSSQDLTMSVNVGLESGLVDIKSNSKGDTNAVSGGSAQKGGDAESDGGGVGLGGDFNASWTNPNASDPSDGSTDPAQKYGDQLGQTPGDAQGANGAIQLGLADVNGDSLPDRVYATPKGVFARYNLGYEFASAPVKLSGGGFDSQESYAGGLSLGFATPWADFSGGVALNWDADLARYAWVDVNGDGILDQLHKVDGGPPTVRFGTGSGMLPPVPYGTTAAAKITDAIDSGQQIAFDRSNGLGGQFDFTIAIGPLCLVACYLIVNPGASYQNSVSSSEVDLQDVNGDGYADSVKSTDDNSLTVRENKQADTNLLSTVHNPLGGTIGLTYKRDGNTVDNPGSVWDMASVTVNDGRPGDGVDVTHTGYSYDGLRYDRLQRTSLGYSTATEIEYDENGTARRQTVHSYENDNVFDAGLETKTLVEDADGNYLHGTVQTWDLQPVSPSSGLDYTSPAALTYSVAPLMTRSVQQVGTGSGTDVGQSTTTDYTYDSLGDVVRQVDYGEPGDPNDDVEADITYTRCDTASALSHDDGACAADRPHPNPSPLFADGLCGTWVSIPGEITVTNGKPGSGRVVYRHRNGLPALCDNASVTHLEQSVDGRHVATTDLTYDAWGNYNRSVSPLGANGKRYAVCYVYDGDQHGQIAKVTEYELAPSAVDDFLAGIDCPAAGDPEFPPGLTSSATFDPLSGGVASRTDANGNVIRSTYDPLGRIASVSSPVTTDPRPLITYDYSLQPGNSHVIAHHFDVFHPNDTIDTATFVDGIGRVVQTKRDAAVYQGPGKPALTSVVASGTTKYDALGRAVSTYNPFVSTKPMGQYDDTQPLSDPHTDSEWDLWDEIVKLTEPGNRVTSSDFEFGNANGLSLFMTTVTAPNGRQTVNYTDMRDVLRASDDVPKGAPAKRMTYLVDGMGQLLKTTDPEGNVTTNAYDMLGRRLSTTTPDSGRTDYAYDPDSELTSKITPDLRTLGQHIGYTYNFHHLTRIDYPGTADDVSYVFGGSGATANGAGRVIREEDGSRITRNGYDTAGDLVRQTATLKLHNWTPSADQSKFTWTTRWSYDGLGRLKTVVLPDTTPLQFTAQYNNGVGGGTDPGEQLNYRYDAGGQLASVVGAEQGVWRQQVGTDTDGTPIYANLPHTWKYSYLADRQYDALLHRRSDTYGNGDHTAFSYDPDTQRLVGQRTVAPGRSLGGQSSDYQEIQDLHYTYDLAGNPTSYRNDLPAPTPSLFGGPSSQTYSYDPYGRLVGATGQWQQSADKQRRYTLSLGYDDAGNLTSKNQRDVINNGKKDLVQAATTYSFTSTFANPAPHQTTMTGNLSTAYDPDGNLTNLRDSKNKDVRTVTWDAADRMRTITDGPQTTTYNYDDQGNRTIERGPAGETATLNQWVTIVDGSPMWKNIWAGDDRIATQRDDGGNNETTKQYFLHKDLQGSTNVVTDANGNVFQHHEYFAGGEMWVAEDSTVFRTPFQYAGGYLDEQRNVIDLSARWYDQIRNIFYSPEPLLTQDPTAVQDEPGLRDAYSYALSDPVGYIDPTGYRPIRPGYTREQDAVIARVRKDWAEGNLPGMDPSVGQRLATLAKRQSRFEMLDEIAQPFVEINVTTGEVRIGPGLIKTWAVRKGKSADAGNATAPALSGTGTSNPATGTAPDVGHTAPSGTSAAVDATDGSGSPAVDSAVGGPATGALDTGKGVPAVRHTPPNKPLPALPDGAMEKVGSE